MALLIDHTLVYPVVLSQIDFHEPITNCYTLRVGGMQESEQVPAEI